MSQQLYADDTQLHNSFKPNYTGVHATTVYRVLWPDQVMDLHQQAEAQQGQDKVASGRVYIPPRTDKHQVV